MKYEFLKIVNTAQGQMAYLLDHTRGVVLIAPVEHFNNTARIPVEQPVYEDYPVPTRVPVNNANRVIPDKPTSIVPPHLRGVFLEPGMDGSAEERRIM